MAMKRVFVVAVSLAAVLVSQFAYGGGKGNIAYSVHNLSSYVPPELSNLSRYIKSNNENQICIFCHTPHNAAAATPLWNKVMPTQQFNMYTTSITLSTTAKKVSQPSPESMLCLSCHDGRTAINVLHNVGGNTHTIPQGSNNVVDIGGTFNDNTNPLGYGYALGGLGFADYGPNLGKAGSGATTAESFYGRNLTDDHPISFSYLDAWNEKKAKLNDIATVLQKSNGRIQFFGPTKRIECSSCHDPHVNYGADRMGNTWTAGNADPTLRPFLVMDNSFSQLCTACHIK
jgi:hypothetical protein